MSAKIFATVTVRASMSYMRRCLMNICATIMQRKIKASRFSYVCMLLTCLFRCSPLAKHLPHPFTSHKYMRAVLPPIPWRFLPAPLAALRMSSSEDMVGTLRPRDFLVRFGTGIGMGEEVMEVEGEVISFISLESELEAEVISFISFEVISFNSLSTKLDRGLALSSSHPSSVCESGTSMLSWDTKLESHPT